MSIYLRESMQSSSNVKMTLGLAREGMNTLAVRNQVLLHQYRLFTLKKASKEWIYI